MTDKDYITYLGKKLLNSGEDCCSMCAYNPEDGCCKNCDGKAPDDEVCIAGMRKFAENKEKSNEI